MHERLEQHLKAKHKIKFHENVNIWKVPCNYHWMQRAIHTFSPLRKRSAHYLFPEGREWQMVANLWGWHRNTSHIHYCSLLWGVSQTYPFKMQDQSRVSQLHFTFGFGYHFQLIKLSKQWWTGHTYKSQGAVLGPVLFTVFITDLEEATVPFIEDTKLGGCIEVRESRAATQGDLEKQADRNLVKLNKDKYKVLHLTKKSSMQQYQLLSHLVRLQRPMVPRACQFGASHCFINKYSYSGYISSFPDQQYPHEHRSDKNVIAAIRMDFNRPP